jgi:hypothetical protein
MSLALLFFEGLPAFAWVGFKLEILPPLTQITRITGKHHHAQLM